MPYYARVDNYRAGDYYRGDPGILGNIAKFGIGLIKKTPIGAIASAAVSLITRPKAPMILPPMSLTTPDVTGRAVMNVPTTYPEQTALLRMPGYERPDVSGGCMIKGRRLNKSTYVTRGGGTSPWPEQIIVHPKGTECVKSRRMNVTNVRALRRAVRRASGFAKLARRVLTFVSAKAPKGRAKFKKK